LQKTKNKNMNAEIFNHFTVNGNRIELPSRDQIEISKQDYAQIKKLMLNNLGKYKNNGFEFSYNPADLLASFKTGQFVNLKKKFQFYATPEPVVEKMLDVLMPLMSLKILEPSVGQGHIIEAIIEWSPAWIEHEYYGYEINPINRGILNEKTLPVKLLGDNFLETECSPEYDAVIMNPPFTVKGDREHYLTHIEHALGFRNTVGELISVVPDSFSFSNAKRVKEFKAKYNGQFSVYDVLNAGDFKSSGTNVKCQILHFHLD
jgi:hypothetical protein